MHPRVALAVAAIIVALAPLAAGAEEGAAGSLRLARGGFGFQLPREIAALLEQDPTRRPSLSLAPVSSLHGFGDVRSATLAADFHLPPDFAAQPSIGPAQFGVGESTGTALDYRFDRWTLSSSVRQGLAATRQGGTRLDLGASYGLNVTPRHEIVFSGGLGFGAGGALQVGDQNDLAVRSALRPYAATGLRDMGLRLSWRYALGQKLFVNTSVGYERMFGDAPDTGLGYERNVGSVGAVFGYRFY